MIHFLFTSPGFCSSERMGGQQSSSLDYFLFHKIISSGFLLFEPLVSEALNLLVSFFLFSFSCTFSSWSSSSRLHVHQHAKYNVA